MSQDCELEPITVADLKEKVKNVKETIIQHDLDKFGHMSDEKIMKAMGVYLYDRDYYIKIGGKRKTNKRKHSNRKTNKRRSKKSRRSKRKIRQTI
jgi:hypothetical protein